MTTQPQMYPSTNFQLQVSNTTIAGPQTSSITSDVAQANFPTTVRPQKISGKIETFQVSTQVDNKLKISSQNIPTNENFHKCGKRMIRHKGIGGTQAEPGAYPWNAALTKPDGTFFCGGVLIDNKHVVTAAHCIIGKHYKYKFGTRDILVIIGAHNLKHRELHKITVAVKSIHVHPDWNPLVLSYDADIAILELANEVQYTSYIQPVCLIEPNSNLSTILDGEVVGFGRSEKAFQESIAQVIQTPMQSNEKCIKTKNHEFLLSHRAFCGGHANGTGVCLGDSGSGLYVFDKGAFYLRGIVSASLRGGLYGCDVNTYAVFTDVIKFYTWVKSGGVHDAETKVQQLEAEIRILRQQLQQGFKIIGKNQNNVEIDCQNIEHLARSGY